MPESFTLSCKRVFDLAVCLVALPVLLPIMAIVAIVVRIGMGSPVLFRQVRPGLHEQPFTIFKFRTMRNEFDASGRLRPDEERLTELGALLRKLSLDELPQMWNVLAGNMSLVGPRPLLLDYLSSYSARQRRRHSVKPGITGWAQVSGRNAISWEQRLECDVWYVEHWSFAFDLRILLRTIKYVSSRSGISNADHVTMPEFTGFPGCSAIEPGTLASVLAESTVPPASSALCCGNREEREIRSSNSQPAQAKRRSDAQGCHSGISAVGQ